MKNSLEENEPGSKYLLTVRSCDETNEGIVTITLGSNFFQPGRR
jgi:hypothetical protein